MFHCYSSICITKKQIWDAKADVKIAGIHEREREQNKFATSQ